jgi:beta-glucanase (GH16 family)
LDSDVWTYDIGTGSDGWGNQELQYYTDDEANVDLVDGLLKITAIRTDTGFTSARIKTQDKVLFQYGTVEARIQVPDVNEGLWPAFWTLGENFEQIGWPASGEIDIMEMGQALAITEGKVNRRVIGAAHWEHEDGYASYSLSKDFDEDLNLNFHIFKLEWTPDYLATYVDGIEVWKMDIPCPVGDEVNCSDWEEFHRPHFFLLNLAVGGRFTGNPRTDVTAPLPATMCVDYVRIYNNTHTILKFPEEEGSTESQTTTALTAMPSRFPTDSPVSPSDSPTSLPSESSMPTGRPSTARSTKSPTRSPSPTRDEPDRTGSIAETLRNRENGLQVEAEASSAYTLLVRRCLVSAVGLAVAITMLL